MKTLLDRLMIRRERDGQQMPITGATYVVVDTELTGLDERKDSIVSIGAVKMVGGRIEMGSSFYRLVHPERKLTAESIVIHGITPSDVEMKPDIAATLAEFLEYCGDSILVGHCLCIDLSFINREMKRLYGINLQNPAIDTFSLYQWMKGRLSGHRLFSAPLRDFRLYEMAECFGVPVHEAHNALMDAYITAQLFQRFIPLLNEGGINTIGALLRAGDPFKGGDSHILMGSM